MHECIGRVFGSTCLGESQNRPFQYTEANMINVAARLKLCHFLSPQRSVVKSYTPIYCLAFQIKENLHAKEVVTK